MVKFLKYFFHTLGFKVCWLITSQYWTILVGYQSARSLMSNSTIFSRIYCFLVQPWVFCYLLSFELYKKFQSRQFSTVFAKFNTIFIELKMIFNLFSVPLNFHSPPINSLMHIKTACHNSPEIKALNLKYQANPLRHPSFSSSFLQKINLDHKIQTSEKLDNQNKASSQIRNN